MSLAGYTRNTCITDVIDVHKEQKRPQTDLQGTHENTGNGCTYIAPPPAFYRASKVAFYPVQRIGNDSRFFQFCQLFVNVVQSQKPYGEIKIHGPHFACILPEE